MRGCGRDGQRREDPGGGQDGRDPTSARADAIPIYTPDHTIAITIGITIAIREGLVPEARQEKKSGQLDISSAGLCASLRIVFFVLLSAATPVIPYNYL